MLYVATICSGRMQEIPLVVLYRLVPTASLTIELLRVVYLNLKEMHSARLGTLSRERDEALHTVGRTSSGCCKPEPDQTQLTCIAWIQSV